MSDKRRQRRGRPKGSGIDDWARLLSIAALMESNPELRVTTAIKQLGFCDPSTIRRLRDKFKINSNALLRQPNTECLNYQSPKNKVFHAEREWLLRRGPSVHKTRAEKREGVCNTPKQRCFKRAQDALVEYAHLADRPVSFVSNFQASIAHCLLQQTQDYGLGM